MPNTRTTVGGAEVIDAIPSLDPSQPRSHLEKKGTLAMLMLLWAICISVVLFLLCWWCTRPSQTDVKDLAVALAGQNATVSAEQLREVLVAMRQEHSTSLKDLFQTLVLSGLVPLFTLIAGYLFGKGQLGGAAPPPGEGGNG